MIKQQYLVFCVLLCALLGAVPGASAEDGQAELDKAMDLKLQASTIDQLGEVAALCEKAIEKGLNPDDEAFAVRLLTGALYQRVRPQIRLIIQLRQLPPELKTRRKAMLADLQKILKYDDKFGHAHLMMAQLEGLDGGDRKQARKSIDQAVALLEQDQDAMAEALLVRGQLQEKEEARLADFDRAVELAPDNPTVWQTRAFYLLMQGEVEKAIADFNKLLEKDESNLLARLAVADTLLKMDQVDEAMKHVNHVIENQPNVIALKLRAQLWSVQQRFDKALEDVEQAIERAPKDLELYLMRARLYHIEDRNALARVDVDRVLQARPGFPPALDLRSSIAATTGQFDDAVKDVTSLLKNDPDNITYKLQLAIYQNAAGESEEAIKIFTSILKTEPGNGVAFRGRADAYLNIGAHKEAIADYEVAVKSAVDDSGILNNFAWVLATSPTDELRDGKRAVELALHACELTNYERAHILSTLAAAYAESGDFKNAVKWSQKAYEMSDESIKEQLKEELECFKNGKPWREVKEEEPKAEKEKPHSVIESDAIVPPPKRAEAIR